MEMHLEDFSPTANLLSQANLKVNLEMEITVCCRLPENTVTSETRQDKTLYLSNSEYEGQLKTSW